VDAARRGVRLELLDLPCDAPDGLLQLALPMNDVVHVCLKTINESKRLNLEAKFSKRGKKLSKRNLIRSPKRLCRMAWFRGWLKGYTRYRMLKMVETHLEQDLF
jgi:hypothetical protein